MNHYRLYSDFNCPFCYAMHERLHALDVMDRVSWHGVQHASHFPLPMPTWSGYLAAELKQEVETIRRLAPELPIIVPRGKPKTRRAIAAAARAMQIDPVRAQAFTRSLYRMFWVDGQDLSDEAVLQQEAERQGFVPVLIAGVGAIAVEPLLSIWEKEWIETEHHGVPILERPDRTALVGLVPVESIQKFLSGG